MKTSISENEFKPILQELADANKKFANLYPGESLERQPVHTLYGGAQLYKAGTTRKIGELSVRAFEKYATNPQVFARAVGMSGDEAHWHLVFDRVKEKLKNCAVEDYRIDFEDGYGNRSNSEEDEAASFTAKEVAQAMKENILSPFIGIRIKSMSEENKNRSLRTLALFLTTLLSETNKKIPTNFIITLPKVSIPEQVTALDRVLTLVERNNGLELGSLKIEIMIETTQAIINDRGGSNLPLIVRAANGRCRGAHFGTYDYTASCDITAAHQKMDHPSCDFALQMMKVSLAGTGVWLSNGATSVMPVGDQDSVFRAWRLSFEHISHSLKLGYYQGWDLHPTQLPIRYAACFSFFLLGLEEASNRLKNFIEKAAQATLVGDIFDDAATGQGLLNYFLRALNSGAISEEEVQATGLSIEEVRKRSFLAILEGRKK